MHYPCYALRCEQTCRPDAPFRVLPLIFAAATLLTLIDLSISFLFSCQQALFLYLMQEVCSFVIHHQNRHLLWPKVDTHTGNVDFALSYLISLLSQRQDNVEHGQSKIEPGAHSGKVVTPKHRRHSRKATILKPRKKWQGRCRSLC